MNFVFFNFFAKIVLNTDISDVTVVAEGMVLSFANKDIKLPVLKIFP